MIKMLSSLHHHACFCPRWCFPPAASPGVLLHGGQRNPDRRPLPGRVPPQRARRHAQVSPHEGQSDVWVRPWGRRWWWQRRSKGKAHTASHFFFLRRWLRSHFYLHHQDGASHDVALLSVHAHRVRVCCHQMALFVSVSAAVFLSFASCCFSNSTSSANGIMTLR